MISKKSKLKVLFILSLITIFQILLLSCKSQKYVPIKEISLLKDSSQFKTSGFLKKIDYNDNFLVLTLNETQTPFFVFNQEFIDISLGKEIEIFGRIQKDSKDKRVIVNKIII